LNATDESATQCLAAVTADREATTAKEVVERAVRNRRLAEELSHEPGVRPLHRGEGLTILHVVMPKHPVGAADPIPHDHHMWAVIGVMHGGEENEFFRRSAHTVEPSGGRVLTEGDVFVMGKDTIHSVKNPSSERLSSALHVDGGDLIGTAKSMWCEPDRSEQPFDFARVVEI
jgi:predicted metal-dependent enzyme (double-stranded beta helix superfamily)